MSIQPRYPTAYLKNTTTGRFHFIVFYPSPRPSDGDSDVCRFRSKGHHTNGFASKEEARTFITQQPNLKEVELELEWDGVTSPHMSMDFSQKEFGWVESAV